MTYRHIGGLHDFGDEETEKGKRLASEYDSIHEENLRKARLLYKEELRLWERETLLVKQQNKQLERKHQQKLKMWKAKIKQLERKYQQDLESWEASCDKSIFGLFKKLLRIKKPKLESVKKPKLRLLLLPPKPEFDY